MVQAILYV